MNIPIGTLVRVHKNLLRQKAGHPEQWSVCVKVKGKGWRLSQYAETVTLVDAEPIVSVKGAERIRKNNSREVVAKIQGTLVVDPSAVIDEWSKAVDAVEVHYNPFKNDNFMVCDRVFTHADIAYFPSCTAFFIAV